MEPQVIGQLGVKGANQLVALPGGGSAQMKTLKIGMSLPITGADNPALAARDILRKLRRSPASNNSV